MGSCYKCYPSFIKKIKMKIFALADCNNFYVSCERVFNPAIRNKPVVVLSNNDGCVVARSQEAKNLNIKMAVPFFKIKDLMHRYDIKAFSSNYPLYADMSRRVMNTLSKFAPEMEVYSIDEAFLDFSDFAFDLEDYSREIRKTVYKHTGLPISIGIAKTKTLAKIGNTISKTGNTAGVFYFKGKDHTDFYLDKFPVDKIWGVGRKSAIYLKSMGIRTALDLKNAKPHILRPKMGVHIERIISELNGEPSYELENEPAVVKGIRSSRTFPRPVRSKEMLKQAISTYASIGGLKLRKNALKAGSMVVFVRSGKHCGEISRNSKTIIFDVPTQDTSLLISTAAKAVESIFENGVPYKKAGIMLNDLSSENKTQLSLFPQNRNKKEKPLMTALDAINNKFGADSIKFGACGIRGDESWRLRCENKSPSYTTNWNEIPLVK